MSKKSFTGTVVSDKTQNSVVVVIERKVIHPKYGKLLKKTKRIMADTSSFSEGKNGMEVSLGMFVEIEETRPLSKSKNFKVVKVITALKKTPGFQLGDELKSDTSASFRGSPALKSGEDAKKKEAQSGTA